MECEDLPGIDQWGDDCGSYSEEPRYCGTLFDTDEFQSQVACCVCGGGEEVAAMSVQTGLIALATILCLILIIFLIIAILLWRLVYERTEDYKTKNVTEKETPRRMEFSTIANIEIREN